LAIASQAGFLCYISIEELKKYVKTKILTDEATF